jgi:hypothetical protein
MMQSAKMGLRIPAVKLSDASVTAGIRFQGEAEREVKGGKIFALFAGH